MTNVGVAVIPLHRHAVRRYDAGSDIGPQGCPLKVINLLWTGDQARPTRIACLQDERNIGDPDLLSEVAGELQMDSNSFRTAPERVGLRSDARQNEREVQSLGHWATSSRMPEPSSLV